jgi:hypothetical protein
VNNRSNGRGCSICRSKTVVKSTSLSSTHPHIAATWHPTKNGNLTADQVTHSSSKKIWWICERNHEWESVLYTRSKLHGCPICRKSKGEITITKLLEDWDISFQREFRISDCRYRRPLPFDFMILSAENTPMATIEYHGAQHFESIKFFGGYKSFRSRQIKDQIKREYCQFNDIQLLEIPYTEIDNIPSLLFDFLNRILPEPLKLSGIAST